MYWDRVKNRLSSSAGWLRNHKNISHAARGWLHITEIFMLCMFLLCGKYFRRRWSLTRSVIHKRRIINALKLSCMHVACQTYRRQVRVKSEGKVSSEQLERVVITGQLFVITWLWWKTNKRKTWIVQDLQTG